MPDDVTRTSSPSGGWLSSAGSISHGRFAPGALVAERYRIIGLLGKGGMGEVYRADDLRLGQQVALKFLPEGLAADPGRLAQFHNEVRTAREVSHPNVCRVHDVGQAGGQLYLSMEYVDGEDLSTSLRRIGRFPEDKAIEIARQLCAGLAAAHQRGVIHRDLKPANIMLDGAGRVRIMDFGLAAVGEVNDVRAGTPAYMAPEQLSGQGVGPKSDIFALGLVLYELFTGRRAFSARTVADLIAEHQAGVTTQPSTVIAGLDPAVERAIMRCLESDPARCPPSVLAVSAALPGGDPLAAALAAGETPSPEMVAAAGEGAGLSPRAAVLLLAFVVIALIGNGLAAVRTSPLEIVRPHDGPEVLAQRARDVMKTLGYDARARDEAYGFDWSDAYTTYVLEHDAAALQWRKVLTEQPSPLTFWFRRSDEPLASNSFHTDLLTPGIVDQADPPTTTAGMAQVRLDHEGRLRSFEAMPHQLLEKPIAQQPVDWRPVFGLAGLDLDRFRPAAPTWLFLAASDTRVAWDGEWPVSGRPLHVEGAALGGRVVAFYQSGPWTKPWREPAPPDSSATTTYIALLLMSAFLILALAAVLARRNIRSGRGDRRGAARLAAAMTAGLLLLWSFSVHLVASVAVAGSLLIAVATSVFYGVLLWTIYIALEPFVRRHWPKVLVSWANAFGGRIADPIVGRDALVGVAVGGFLALALRAAALLTPESSALAFAGDFDLLLDLRHALATVVAEAPYAIRNALLYFFALFVLKVLLKKEWLAGAVFTLFFMVLNALGNDHPWFGAAIGMIYFATFTIVIVRNGLLAFAVASFVSGLLFDVIATRDTSAWFVSNSLLVIAIVLAIAIWGAVRATAGRAWTFGSSLR